MYNAIVNPVNNQMYSLNSRIGKRILRNYINVIIHKGGYSASDNAVEMHEISKGEYTPSKLELAVAAGVVGTVAAVITAPAWVPVGVVYGSMKLAQNIGNRTNEGEDKSEDKSEKEKAAAKKKNLKALNKIEHEIGTHLISILNKTKDTRLKTKQEKIYRFIQICNKLAHFYNSENMLKYISSEDKVEYYITMVRFNEGHETLNDDHKQGLRDNIKTEFFSWKEGSIAFKEAAKVLSSVAESPAAETYNKQTAERYNDKKLHEASSWLKENDLNNAQYDLKHASYEDLSNEERTKLLKLEEIVRVGVAYEKAIETADNAETKVVRELLRDYTPPKSLYQRAKSSVFGTKKK